MKKFQLCRMMFKAFLGLTPAYSSASFLLTSPYILVLLSTKLPPIPAIRQPFCCLSAFPALKWEASQFPQQPVLTSNAEAPHVTLQLFSLHQSTQQPLRGQKLGLFYPSLSP